MGEFQTQYFKPVTEEENPVSTILKDVVRAMQAKGYDPTQQLVGYIMSDDPTYVTSYQNARTKLSSLKRDAILEELIRSFLEKHGLE